MGLHFTPSKAFVSIPEVRSGIACFTGARVGVSQLLHYLQAGYTVDGFLSDFSTVTKERVDLTIERIASECIRDDECVMESTRQHRQKQQAAPSGASIT